MFKDKGPNYSLGFGIPPANTPITTDPTGGPKEGGLSPNAGVVAKALYDHPIAKFFAVSAATMVGTAVGSAMVRRGGIRLGEKIATSDRPFFDRLSKSMRQTKSYLDDLEGIDSDLGNDPTKPIKKASFWQNYEHRKANQENGIEDDGERWLLRDELQQRLIHQARSLPYQLPALYVANRAANSLVGNQNTPVNWKNPIDVIGDFAQSSVHQLAGLLTPAELGQGTLKYGWQRLMTDGDFVSSQQPFSKLQNYNLSLKTILDQFGQDSVDIIHQATRRSGQTAGAFSNALTEAANSQQPIGIDWFGKDRDATTHAGKNFRVKRIKQIMDAHDTGRMMGREGNKGAIEAAVPTLSGFVRGFGQSWMEHNDDYLNLEAARKGQKSYLRNGREVSVDINRIHTSNYITQLDQSIGVTRTNYAKNIKDESYKRLLQEELAKRIAAGTSSGKTFDNANEAARRFMQHAQIGLPFRRDVSDTNMHAEVVNRVRFGTSLIPDTQDRPWETEFVKRLNILTIPTHAENIALRLPEAMRAADQRFLDPAHSKSVDAHINRTFEDIRQRIIIPEARSQLGQTKLHYEDFGRNAEAAAREQLIRTTAERLGMPLREGGTVRSTATLQAALKAHGIDSTGQMRGVLLDQGAMSAPWTKGGFNFFGLRPLTAQTALKANYFGSQQKSVQKLFDDMGRYDSYGRNVDRPVGKYIWESRTGKIVDLNPTIQGAVKSVQAFARHVEVPFLHFSPPDLTSFKKLTDFANGPSIKISSARDVHFGPISSELPPSDYDSHVWIKGGSGFRGKGSVFGYRQGSEVGRATGSYYATNTMGEDTWARNLRIALNADTGQGIYNPPYENKDHPRIANLRNRTRKFFRVAPEQPSSIPNLIRRGLNGEFGERYLGRDPDVKNPAVMARLMENGEIPDELTSDWFKGARNLEKELNKYHLPPAVVRHLETTNPELAERLRIRDSEGREVDLSHVRNGQTLLDVTRSQFDRDLEDAGSLFSSGDLTREDINAIRQAQGRIKSIYLDRSTAESLNQEASRAVATAGINTRMDEMKGEIYKYLVTRASSLANEDTSVIIQDLLDAIDSQSSGGYITGAQRTEARAAVMSMQMNIDGLKHGGALNDIDRTKAQLRGLIDSPAGQALHHLSNYDTALIHHKRYLGLEAKVSRALLKRFGVHKEEVEGFRFNPYGADQEHTFVPTFETAFWANPLRATASALGATTWKDPEAFSAVGIRTSHLATRLNRYFSMGGAGVDESAYNGPLGFVAGGLVGKRILPLAIGSALFFGLDAELGGLVHGKDQNGNRQYTPLISGTLATAVAHGIVVGAGITGGYKGYKEKKAQYFGDENVPIRKGRYWPLGNQPLAGGRIQYYRPNWYKRFMSGYKYTDQTYGSPLERLAYDYDFSPLHLVDPYHFEKQHYSDRPYPVTGDLFTGPWGPVNTVLNATVGKVIKPHKLMHQDEFQQAMEQNYQRVGEYGMQYVGDQNPYPRVLTRSPSGGTQISAPTPTGYYLGPGNGNGMEGPTDGYTSPYNQPYGFMGQPYGTSPGQAIDSYRKGAPNVSFAPGDADVVYANGVPIRLKDAGGSASLKRVTMARGSTFDPTVIPASDPLNPGHLNVQAGQFGYDAQEMAGIYGFAYGTARQMAGFGSASYTPDSAVLQQASRAYGSERSFWDLNLGGLGDFPTPLRGEYGNIEFSEIARRFIPHRRHDVDELNPLPNQMAEQFPWLPGSDYYINFQTGDPYIAVPEGEMRLPGAGYERTHQLHPDDTGQYGLLDQHRILGDVAPWSEEYRSVDKVLRKSNLTAEEKQFVQTTRNQVAGVKKRHNFKPYKYAHADFQQKDVKAVGFMPGDADHLITDAGVVQLAGVRARKTQDAMNIAQSMIHAGDTVSITYDANAPTTYNSPIDASVQAANGKDLGQALLSANQAYMGKKNSPLDNRVRQGPVSFYLHQVLERAQHANTVINQKFVPDRSAVEEWERYHVYGTDFPEWTHPIQDFIEPLGQRARNRNPAYAAGVLSYVGRAFGRTPQGKTAGSIIGAGTGAYLSATSNAKTLETGSRYIPPRREKQMALDEYTDILSYVKYAHLYNMERQEAIDEENSDPEKYADKVEKGRYKKYQFTNLGPHTLAALEYRKEMKQTEYGADLFGDVMNESAALPKNKRDYFMPFLNSPKNEHARILSTAPRLERRMYEARWGMAIEDKPDLADYFSEHELPDENWEGWSPDIDMQDVELKMMNQQGLEASQAGYYPQQVQQANLINPSYPDFNQKQSEAQAAVQLLMLLKATGFSGDVTTRRTSTPGRSVNLQMGVQSSV